MAVPIRHKDILKNYVDDARNVAWARDLVCLAIQTGGIMTDTEQMKVLEECERAVANPTVSLPSVFTQSDPALQLLRLKHIHGVNALADNQEIIFCNEGVTLLYGHNRSGKSGYFRTLNQMAGGEVSQALYQNVHSASPAPIEVELEYSLDGMAYPAFNWKGTGVGPAEIRHIRFFDSRYATNYLSKRDGNTFFFKSQNLMVFKAINDTLDLIKGSGAVVDAAVETGLRNLCSTAYRDALTQALVDAFQDELAQLGMSDLKVTLSVGDLLNDSAEVAVKLTNSMDINGILSEAEQNCAALALFFAELDLMEVKQPIVLDDPVNSLDDIFIERFAHRISQIDSQVLIFTHNILLFEALTDGRRFKVFKNSSVDRTRSTTAKKHELVYDVLTSRTAFGYVVNNEDKKTTFYLNEAQTKLSATPVTDAKGIVDSLRMAVEWAIDEVVFRSLAPRRFKGSEQTDWATMETMTSVGPNNVRELHDVYDQLSVMGIHLGYMSYVPSATVTKLQKLHDRIKTVFDTL